MLVGGKNSGLKVVAFFVGFSIILLLIVTRKIEKYYEGGS